MSACSKPQIAFQTCSKCPFELRLARDGSGATINLDRITSDRDRAARVARAEKLVAAFFPSTPRENARVTRPLMGWSSWNTFGIDISEDIVVDVARAMAANGLKAAGYNFVNIDDGFFNGRGTDGKLRIHPVRFPNGLRPVVEAIHAQGLKAGIYADAGNDTCGCLCSGDEYGRGAGLLGHDADDFKFYFHTCGFDFIKVDFCGGRSLKLDQRTRYEEVARALRATGKSVRFNICCWTFPGTWAADIAESWRTSEDIRARWSDVVRIIRENLYCSAYVSPGHYNDLDMLEIGNQKGRTRTFFGCEDDGLTAQEEITHFGVWCMLSSPLLMGCDVRNMPASSMALATNPFLLAMNQNDLGLSGYVVQREGLAYVLVKDADVRYGTARFVGLCNLSDAPHTFTVSFDTLDLAGRVAAFDLVEGGDLGTCEGCFTLTVPAHGSRFFRLDAERRLQRTMYGAETAYLSEYQNIRPCREAGTAFPCEVPNAHNGVAVVNLGGRETNDLIWKDVRIEKEGVFRLCFHVAAQEESSFAVQIDGGEKRLLRVPPTQGAFIVVGYETTLAVGVHAVRLAQADGPMPDVDCLTLSEGRI